MADEKFAKMKVRANETFWERHPQHPDGEVFIAKGEEGVVAETPDALTAIGKGKLIRISGGDELAKAMEQRAAGGSGAPEGSGTPTLDPDAIYEEFPGSELLIGAGYKSLSEVDAAADGDLLKIKGLGQGTLTQIRTARGSK